MFDFTVAKNQLLHENAFTRINIDDNYIYTPVIIEEFLRGYNIISLKSVHILYCNV